MPPTWASVDHMRASLGETAACAGWPYPGAWPYVGAWPAGGGGAWPGGGGGGVGCPEYGCCPPSVGWSCGISVMPIPSWTSSTESTPNRIYRSEAIPSRFVTLMSSCVILRHSCVVTLSLCLSLLRRNADVYVRCHPEPLPLTPAS